MSDPHPATPAPRPSRHRSGFDWVSFLLASAVAGVVGWTIWLKYGPPGWAEPPSVGTRPPVLRLTDLEGEPLALLGFRDRVVWIAFVSVDQPGADEALKALDGVRTKLRGRGRFTLVTTAVEPKADVVRAALGRAKVDLPVYLATDQTRHTYGVIEGPTLHVLIGEDGLVLAVARGHDQGTIDRLYRSAIEALDSLDPLGGMRFAALPPPDRA